MWQPINSMMIRSETSEGTAHTFFSLQETRMSKIYKEEGREPLRWTRLPCQADPHRVCLSVRPLSHALAPVPHNLLAISTALTLHLALFPLLKSLKTWVFGKQLGSGRPCGVH